MRGSRWKTWLGMSKSLAKKAVQIDRRTGPDHVVERPLLGNFLRRGGECVPRLARERAADADATHTELGRLRNGDPIAVDEQIHRLRRDRLDDRRDVFLRADARRVQT